MFKDKAEHDKYIRAMISNLGHDVASYNLTNRPAIRPRDIIPGALMEKIHHQESDLRELQYNIERLRHMIDKGYDDTEQLIQLELLQVNYKAAMEDLVTGYGITIECFERIAKGKM